MLALRRLLIVPALAVLPMVGLTSCGSSPPHKKAAAAVQCGSGSSAIPLIPSADLSPAGTWGKAPTVKVPPGSPPDKLECAQLISGSGPGAESGDTLNMEYVLATYSSGGVVQSSWTSAPFSFTLGQQALIQGWVDGVLGMQAGSRRELIIPPGLGYGASSPGPGIAPNDTLVFVLDLQSIT